MFVVNIKYRIMNILVYVFARGIRVRKFDT